MKFSDNYTLSGITNSYLKMSIFILKNKYIIYCQNCFKNPYNSKIQSAVRPDHLSPIYVRQNLPMKFCFYCKKIFVSSTAPLFYPLPKSQEITKLDFFTLPQKMRQSFLFNVCKAIQDFIFLNLLLTSVFVCAIIKGGCFTSFCIMMIR